MVLIYSPMIDITNSSASFLACFGAPLSVVKKIPIEPTVSSVDLALDTLPEDKEDPAEPSSDGHGDSYRPSGSGGSSHAPVAPSRRRTTKGDNSNADDSLMVCSILTAVGRSKLTGLSQSAHFFSCPLV